LLIETILHCFAKANFNSVISKVGKKKETLKNTIEVKNICAKMEISLKIGMTIFLTKESGKLALVVLALVVLALVVLVESLTFDWKKLTTIKIDNMAKETYRKFLITE
jgi:hypothetical protein